MIDVAARWCPGEGRAAEGAHPDPGGCAILGPVLGRLVRAVVKFRVDQEQLPPGVHLDRSGAAMLHALAEAGAPMRLSDLAVTMCLDLSTVSRQVRGLVDEGLVERSPDPVDKRASRLTVTPSGGRALAGVLEARRSELERALGAWDEDEVSETVRVLERLTSALEQDLQHRSGHDRLGAAAGEDGRGDEDDDMQDEQEIPAAGGRAGGRP